MPSHRLQKILMNEMIATDLVTFEQIKSPVRKEKTRALSRLTLTDLEQDSWELQMRPRFVL